MTSQELQPTEADHVVSADLPATSASVGVARRMVTGLAAAHGAGPGLLDDVALAVTEAVANAVVHGSRGRPDAVIGVCADVEDGILEVVVRDDGEGIRPGRPSEGAGLGLAMIAAIVPQFELTQRAQNGVEVWMRWALG